ncbi:UNVERIFIED_CONTAM: hypothetical protein RMT77_007827 [Armadillidium vulgare]
MPLPSFVQCTKYSFRCIYIKSKILILKMRRRAGVGAIQRQKIQQDKFKEKGNEIQENQLEEMKLQMEKFKENLEEYAAKHKHEIKGNPVFRKQFQNMCASIGVDPLASGKGFWCEMLGVGDFYYELGVQIVELGVATSHQNGGVLPMQDVIRRLNLRRREENKISEDDIMRAVKKLQVLGSGMEVIESGRSKFICSVPGELSMDHTILLQEAEKIEPLSVRKASEHLKWSAERVARGLDHLLRVGIAWIDTQDSPPTYWFPAVFQRRFQANLQ